MTTFNYQEILDVADEIIKEFGRGAGLRRKINGGTVTRACTIVEVGYTPSERDGSSIQFTDRRFLCSPAGLSPDPDAEEDKLMLDGKELRIVTVTRTQPASLNVLWDMQVRL